MEPLVLPSWFKQRQGKTEPAGDNSYKLTAPQQAEAFIRIRPGGEGRWSAAVSPTANGPDVAATAAEFRMPGEAWAAAFELYRRQFIV
jgi:hypothetical protein